MGFGVAELSIKLSVSQPPASFSVKRGEKIATAEQFELVKDKKVIILWDVPYTYVCGLW